MPNLNNDLLNFGANESCIRWLDRASAKNIAYLDLIRNPNITPANPDELLPEVVVERDSQALAYILRADSLASDDSDNKALLLKLRKNLACRADAKYLGIWRPGELEIYPIGLNDNLPAARKATVSDDPFLFQEIANGTFKCPNASPHNEVHSLLFDVLKDVSNHLIEIEHFKVEPDDVISLIGRALFVRFLIDRGIINDETFPELFVSGTPEQCFENAENASLTCHWLEDKFNGNLLPLSNSDFQSYFQILEQNSTRVFHHLTNIMYRAPGGQQTFSVYWDAVNFAHVPVGLLSRVYENFAHALFSTGAKAESIYYTPYFIADLTVDQTFDAIDTDQRHLARVLDPASGAGVFLITALRRLVKERWLFDGAKKRPDYKEIRKIMSAQVVGFDINESALRLSALGLYLTAIELDPDPFPPSKLRFPDLKNKTLFCTRSEDEAFPKSLVLGSLGDGAPKKHEGRYDIVLGNPPWTSWSGVGSDDLNKKVEAIIRDIAKRRATTDRIGAVAKSYLHPDKVSDLPFVWKAMDWAKPNGIISFAIHGRLQFKRDGLGKKARDDLFSVIKVTGLINGSEVDKKKVWPGMDAPFCLLFARNEPPSPQDCFKYISLEHDAMIEASGRMRIDYAKSQAIQFSYLEKNPALLRTLSIGTSLDAGVIKRIEQTLIHENNDGLKFLRLSDYWTPQNNLHRGQGFRSAKDQKQNPAQFIKNMAALTFTKKDAAGFFIDTASLPLFDQETLHTPREDSIYKPPLVLVNESPGEKRQNVRARISLKEQPIAFNQSFFGYSAYGHPQANDLAQYLFVITNSDLFVYYMLINSAKFADRRTLYTEDVNSLPILPVEHLSKKCLATVRQLAQSMKGMNPVVDWVKLNAWVFELYGLDDMDQLIMADTLATRLPYKVTRQYATSRPTENDVSIFTKTLEYEIDTWFALRDINIKCQYTFSISDPFLFIDIKNADISVSDEISLPEVLSHLANNNGTTRIIHRGAIGRLRVGILAQKRYWTQSRAHLLAFNVIRKHKDQLFSES